MNRQFNFRERRLGRQRARVSGAARERGVASVLSMMFLILFGSLAAAMAIATRGNIRTAATHIHVMRAQGAAETGLAVARARLNEAFARFIVSKSEVDSSFGTALWTGSTSSLGTVTVLGPTGYTESSSPSGVAQALANRHAADQNVVTAAGVSSPTIGNAPSGTDLTEFASSGWVFTPAIAVDSAQLNESSPVCFSVTYAPLNDGVTIRAIVTGFDFGYSRNSEPLARKITQDFRMTKRVNQAVISPTRVMIGKNVMVSGDLGCNWDKVTNTNGDPLVLKSDFYGLSANLDKRLDKFFAAVRQYDTDGDNRLRVRHPVEGASIPSNNEDLDGDGNADNAYMDATGDGYVDDFDIFIRSFDKNGDGRLVLTPSLTIGTPNESSGPEFEVDNELALLIDSANPDRNKNGISGFTDANNNGYWDDGEVFADVQIVNGVSTNADQVLGYRDGAIDRKDQYAKVAGKLIYRVTKAAWTTAQGNIADKVRGPVVPGKGNAPVAYGVDTSKLPAVTASTFSQAADSMRAAASGDPFSKQVADQLGVSVAALGTYTETKAAGLGTVRYFRVDPDNNSDGRPDNWSTAYWEKMPFNSPNVSDYYFRPVYENMVFRNVQIPMGNNGLYRNCTFIGVTFVRTESGNTSRLWAEYGRMKLHTDGKPIMASTRIIYGDDSGETFYPTMLPSTAKPPNQMIMMASSAPLDKADIPSNQTGSWTNYSSLPDPLIINGLRVTDTRQYSNNIRFHDCLFVGSIVSDTPTGYTQTRNKIQFTGATKIVQKHPQYPDDPLFNPTSSQQSLIKKSSMMLPNYSVDLGTFNSPPSQDVRLSGAIIAGVLDVRGNASIDGSLMLTFDPTPGQGPMVDIAGNAVGNPANFNTTIGYFGPDDGDAEGMDVSKLPKIGGKPVVGWDTDGDGLFDVPSTTAQPAGSTPIYFNGYGRCALRFNPTMTLPDGIMLPMQVDVVPNTYKEGAACDN
ncbi:MAG: hypothetical protein SFY96_05565 [Planctomycetota bacterium]|nr:hypothetical protein [Planctomycetota bacterium]